MAPRLPVDSMMPGPKLSGLNVSDLNATGTSGFYWAFQLWIGFKGWRKAVGAFSVFVIGLWAWCNIETRRYPIHSGV